MAKSEFGTASFLSKQMKARGLQKLKLYCQVCQKQCRDDNGFRSHIKSPSHLRKISTVTQKDIEEYSSQFEKGFLRLMRISHGEKKIGANKFYNEFIQDKDHIHMNSTKFTSLSKFLQHLSKSGKIKVHGIEELADDSDTGKLLISLIDNSYENLLRKEKLQEIEKTKYNEQSVKNKLLEKMIKAGLAHQGEEDKHEEELVLFNDDTKISLNIKNNVKASIGSKKIKKKNKITKNVFGKK